MSNVTKPVMLDDTGKSVAQALGSVATAINNMDKVQWGQVKGTLSNQTDLKNNLDSLQGQIDSFTALTPGSTTGDAELTNIRVDSSGTTYNTAGDAVRAIDSQVKALKTGFDGVVYPSPAEQVIGSDTKLQSDIKNNTRYISNKPITLDVLVGYWESSGGTFVYYASADTLRSTEKFIVAGAKKAIIKTQMTAATTVLFWSADGTYIGYSSQYLGNDIVIPENAEIMAIDYAKSEGLSSMSVLLVSESQEIISMCGSAFEKKNLFDGDTSHSGILNQNTNRYYGDHSEAANYFYTNLIPIGNITKLYVFNNFKGDSWVYVTFYNAEFKACGSSNGANIIISTIPSGAVYFAVTAGLAYKETLMIYTELPTRYIPYNSYNIYSDNNVVKKYKRIERGEVDGYQVRNINNDVFPLDVNAGINTSYPMDLTGAENISYIAKYYVALFFTGANGKIVSVTSFNANTKGTIAVPSGAVSAIYHVGSTHTVEESATFVKGTTPPDRIYSFDELDIQSETEKDYLAGKKIVFDGDSITEGAGVTDITTGISPNNNKGWGYWVQQNHSGSLCYGFGKSGWTVGRVTGETDSLLNHIESYPEDVDCFVLSGGYNDQAQQMAMGALLEPTDGVDAYFNATFDEYTFYGALESWFKQLRTNYPFAKIVYVMTPQRCYAENPVFNNDTKGQTVKNVLYATGRERFDLFWEAIRKACEKWSIKFLDLSKTCGLVGTGEETDPGKEIGALYWQASIGGMPDFTHPNTNFYKELIVPQIEDLIRSVMPNN